MPLVTVIMPSLNVKDYIQECMESVIGQSLQDIEILAIDAGSTDGTLEILKEYEQKDARVKVIISDKKSYGYQVNLGLEMASGDYIGIVETDDYISDTMFEKLVDYIRENDVDYVKGRVAYVAQLQNGEKWIHENALPIPREFIGQVVKPCDMPELLHKDIYLWLGLYKKKFLENIRLNETPGAAFQDQGFLLKTFSTSESAMYVDEIVYYYRQDNSASSVFNQNGFSYLVGEYCANLSFIEDKSLLWKEAFYLRLLTQCQGRFATMALGNVFFDTALENINILRNMLKEAVEKGILRIELLEDISKERLLDFLQSPYGLYLRNVERLAAKIGIVRSLYNDTKDKDVVIFGCGFYGRFVHTLLEKRGKCNVCAYADNDESIVGQLKQGVEVLLPRQCVDRHPNAMYIMTLGTENSKIVSEQLYQLGVNEKCVYPFRMGIDVLMFQI